MPNLLPPSPPPAPPAPPSPLHEKVEALSLVKNYLQKQITDAAHLDEKQTMAKNKLAARLAARKGARAAVPGTRVEANHMAALAAESTRLLKAGDYRKVLGVLGMAFKIIEKKYYTKETEDGGAPEFGEDRAHVQKIHDNFNLYTAWRKAEDEKNEKEYIKRYEGDCDCNVVEVAETAPEFVRAFVPLIGNLGGLDEWKEVRVWGAEEGSGGTERRRSAATTLPVPAYPMTYI